MPNLLSTEPKAVWLSACYFFFFSILGLMVPYLGVFFDNRGYNAQEIGFLMAILMGTRIIAPNVWAFVADRTGMRSELVKFGSAAAAITYISFFFDAGVVYLAISLFIYTFFWNAILAQLEVITLESLGDEAHRYGAIRSWGSVGYICLVVAGGFAISQFGADILPSIGMLLFIGMFLCSLALPANRVNVADASLRPPLKITAPIFWFLVSALLLQMSVGPFYGFFVLYLKQAGYSEASAGLFVAFGVVVEILMFMLAPRLLGRFGVKLLLLLSVALTAVRWLLLAYGVDSILILSISQALHAFTFGLTHAASIQFIHRNFDIAHRSKGQAMYASISFGFGGALGIWISGLIWGDGSGSTNTWIFAAMCAFLSMLAVMAISEKKKDVIS
ncbi:MULTISPECIES: MFS transporter [unclassified Shewanella]|uniref:MFS transporter n=1 Tax=unclassified Shewanella TaxID=196818 RepID=UPI000C863186|nr:MULTISPECIES: MFS transporter [unclassified Shewanella]MDO6677637.1 MFS transporter [Shewanella sp. 4_MG-2023]PMG42053.1 MFS transporter [Shewanella sp. 10N.286.52.B9]PMI01659.1 MFS transporter [Shewanella sp. 10N.286.48.A6]